MSPRSPRKEFFDVNASFLSRNDALNKKYNTYKIKNTNIPTYCIEFGNGVQTVLANENNSFIRPVLFKHKSYVPDINFVKI